MALGRALLCAAVALLLAGSANAATSFTFVSGEVHITASAGLTPIVDEIVALDGTFLQFETAPVGVPDFEISLAPSGPILMLTPYGGYDTFEILSAVLTPGVSFTTAGSSLGGGLYSVSMGPIAVDAVYSATDSGLITPPSGPVPLSFENPSLTADVDTNLVMFEMLGITLGVIGPFGAETSPLIVKGDITFMGIVPEPTTGLLVGLGLFGLCLRRKVCLRKSVGAC